MKHMDRSFNEVPLMRSFYDENLAKSRSQPITPLTSFHVFDLNKLVIVLRPSFSNASYYVLIGLVRCQYLFF